MVVGVYLLSQFYLRYFVLYKMACVCDEENPRGLKTGLCPRHVALWRTLYGNKKGNLDQFNNLYI